ncbi:MAG TPA: epimerase [Holosporales bacterium]|nr:epimerase [Holosporales bacterium]
MKILITGVAGFIGSNLAEKLLSAGNRIVGLDNFDPFYDKRIKLNNLQQLSKNPYFSFYEGDILDNALLNKLFSNEKIEIVIHLAAKAGVRPSILDPVGYYHTNVIGTLNILEAMKKYQVKKMVFASSSSVYGNNETVPFMETDIVDFPISPYAASKKAGELLCHTYHHLYGFDIFCMRFFTVYGPKQRPDLAIHKFTKALINQEEIPFYGDGSSRRDYTHISDIINGIECAIEKIEGFNIFNLGESKTTSLSELVEYLEKYTNEKAKLIKLPFQPGDVNITYANTEKARKLLNYHPTMNIDDGLKEFVEWFKRDLSIHPVS